MVTLKYKHISVLLIAIIQLIGCTKEVSLDTRLKEEEKIVVFGFISPQDSVLKVAVSKLLSTKDYFENVTIDENSFLITTATVLIKNGAIEKTMLYDMTSKKYILDASEMPIIEGNTYEIEVVVAGFPPITGTTTIPERNTEILPPTAFQSSGFGPNTFIEFNDLPSQENYYQLFAKVFYNYGSPGETSRRIEFDFSELGSISENETSTYSKLISDKNIDGQKLIVKGRESFSVAGEKVIKIYLFTIDKYYYDYHKLTVISEGDNPLIETPNINSNIENGLGIFSGYQQFSKEFTVNN